MSRRTRNFWAGGIAAGCVALALVFLLLFRTLSTRRVNDGGLGLGRQGEGE